MIEPDSIAAPCTVPHRREKESLFSVEEFERNWKQPSLLRPEQKKKIKIYYSLKQGRDGTRALCCFCNKEFAIVDLEVHHKDHNRTNNHLSNVEPSCGPCNRDERAQWMATSYAEQRSVITPKKQTESQAQEITETEKKRLIEKAPWTTQLKIKYRHKTLVYLLEDVKENRAFYVAVADVEALTGCSRDKAIEYLDAFSNSYFAPFEKEAIDGTVYIRPRKIWDFKYATEEYKIALLEVKNKELAKNGQAAA